MDTESVSLSASGVDNASRCTRSAAVNICFVRAVFFFCHSRRSVTARFVFRAQDNNMTNGDFAIFTHQSSRSSRTDRLWERYDRYVDGPYDEQRRRLAFYAIKQVFAFIIAIKTIMFSSVSVYLSVCGDRHLPTSPYRGHGPSSASGPSPTPARLRGTHCRAIPAKQSILTVLGSS